MIFVCVTIPNMIWCPGFFIFGFHFVREVTLGVKVSLPGKQHWEWKYLWQGGNPGCESTFGREATLGGKLPLPWRQPWVWKYFSQGGNPGSESTFGREESLYRNMLITRPVTDSNTNSLVDILFFKQEYMDNEGTMITFVSVTHTTIKKLMTWGWSNFLFQWEQA